MFMIDVFSASSLCFDPAIQYYFRRCVIAPPTIKQNAKSLKIFVNAEKKLTIAFVFIKLVTTVQDKAAKCITSLFALLYI